MAKGAAKPAYSVFRIFNECQKSSAAHNKCAKLLWQLQEKAEDSCFQDICTCLQHILVVAQKEPAVERSVRFVAAFVSWRPEDRSEDCDDFVEQLLTWLLSVAAAKDKAVRYRACQLLFITIENMHVEAGISTELADQLQAAMLERLRDKIPKVREQAARVLTRLGDPGEDGSFANDPVTENLLQLLDIERNKDVRKAVLASLPISDATVGCLMERTRDTSDDVRKMSYAVIAEKVPLTDLSADQWALLLSRGLSDRSAVVRTEATRLLCFWLDKACEKEPLALLAALEVETHEDEAELALKALLAAGALKAISLAHEASASGTGLRRRPEAELMSSEETLLWRVVCEALQGDATTKGRAAAATSGANARVEAAAAGERLEALEAALPETVSALMELAVAHAAAGEEHRFATRQLLHIAARCVDLTDAAGRKAAADMVQKLLREASSGSDRRWDAALVEVARHVYSSHAELAEAMLGAIAEMYARWQLGEPSDAADGEANAAQWVQCLSVASLLLQQVPSARVALALDSLPAGCTSIADLHSLLFMPGVGHPSAAVRAEALRCVGLYCMLEGLPEAPVLQLTILRAVLAAKELALAGSELQDQCVATQALCDLALLRGPKAVDAVYMGLLPRPEASAQAAAGSEPAESSKPLLALLLDCFAKACVVVKPKGRKKAGDMGSDDMPLASAIAEGLAKLLMHQQLWEGPPADAAATKGLEQSDAVKVLSRLLVAYFDPATERAAHLRQCLSVFFHTFAAFSARNQRCLALAFLPAARLALSCGPAKKSPAPLLMRFMLQLLQTPLRSTGDATDDDSNGQLAEALVAEVLACPKGPTSKPYVAGLLKVLVALPLDGTSQPELKRLRAATEQLSKAVSDRMASKDVAAFAKRLAKLDKTPAEGLNEEELAQLLHVMELHDKEPSLQSCPLPFAEASVEATPARARGRNARRVTRSAAVEDNSSSGEEGQEPEPGPASTVRRTAPPRSARPQCKLVDSVAPLDFSDEEDAEAESDADSAHNEAQPHESAPAAARKAIRLSAATPVQAAVAAAMKPMGSQPRSAKRRLSNASPLVAAQLRQGQAVIDEISDGDDEDEAEDQDDELSDDDNPATSFVRPAAAAGGKAGSGANPGATTAAGRGAVIEEVSDEESGEDASDSGSGGDENMGNPGPAQGRGQQGGLAAWKTLAVPRQRRSGRLSTDTASSRAVLSDNVRR